MRWSDSLTPASPRPARISRQDAPTVGAWPTLIAILVTVGLQWRWHHALLSIFAGTGVYVLLRNAPMLF